MPTLDNFSLSNQGLGGPSLELESTLNGTLNIVAEDGTARNSPSNSYTKIKAIQVGYKGKYRITTNTSASTSITGCKIAIFVNGVYQGVSFDVPIGSGGQTFEVTVNAGDSIEVWVYHTGGNSFNVSRVTLYSSLAPVGKVTLS
ncbi:hypothetical protein MKX33_04480 [Paenibacillus sp. FSL R5-0490]|uniref:hypothetical protein n=1 Tax=unclassified Paenibacillus TaxID=185978 RepID=UPI0030CFF2BF